MSGTHDKILPEAAQANLDSMLRRKFGKEVANYFSGRFNHTSHSVISDEVGSPLNRVSFLRPDYSFLSAAFKHSTTNFILFRDLAPLINKSKELAYVRLNDVQSIIGNDPYSKSEDDQIRDYNSEKHIPQLVFLGIDERNKDGLTWKDSYTGAPYFALDITPKDSMKSEAESLTSSLESRGFSFPEGRQFQRFLSLPPEDAAIYACARHMLDWNLRNPFCATCGNRTLSINGGFKRTCPPSDFAEALARSPTSPFVREPCASRMGISNISFPRTDPTVIMAVVSSDGQRILLGRQERYPQYWYSTLAGFLEPAESVEEAVRREVWEESGITVGRVVVHSTQPWPYPANLMIGAIGQATPDGEKINLGNDAELEDAKWFGLDEVREALDNATSGIGDEPASDYKKGALRLPPTTAIANQLIRAIVDMSLNIDSKM